MKGRTTQQMIKPERHSIWSSAKMKIRMKRPTTERISERMLVIPKVQRRIF